MRAAFAIALLAACGGRSGADTPAPKPSNATLAAVPLPAEPTDIAVLGGALRRGRGRRRRGPLLTFAIATPSVQKVDGLYRVTRITANGRHARERPQATSFA
jgi:hypothetical protein